MTDLRVCPEPTDCERVLLALRAMGPKGIHSRELRTRHITGNPSQRIADLEAKGYVINHEREHIGKRPGTRYRLVSEPETAGLSVTNEEGNAGQRLSDSGTLDRPGPPNTSGIPAGASSSSDAESGSASLPTAAMGLTSASGESPGASGVDPDTTAAPSPCSSTSEQRPCKSQVAGSSPAGGSTAGPNVDASSGVVDDVSVGSGSDGSARGAPPHSASPPVPAEPPARLFGDDPPTAFDPYSEAA